MGRVCVWRTVALCALMACKGGEPPAPSDGSGVSLAGSSGAPAAGIGGSAGAGSGGSAAGSGGTGVGGMAGSRAGAGGGSSGNSADAGPPDAGAAAGASCAEGTYLLCEDFEDTAVDAIPSGWTKHGDPIAVADDQAASGKRSLKIGKRDNGERRIYHDATMLPSTHWGRVRFKVELPVPDAFVHSTIVALYGKSPKPDMANLEVRVVDTVKESKQGFNNDGNGSHYQVLYNVQPENRGEFGHASTYDWKFDDAWHCAEWRIDSAQQSFQFFYDGEEIEDVGFSNGAGNFDDSEIPSKLSEIRLGWNNYQGAPPGFVAWIDDFAIAAQRIPCE